MFGNFISSIVSKFGVDKAIAYSSAARIVHSITNFVTLVFIATYLTEEEQGFYYTFGSIIGIQVFFELGFTSIITQYVAHEAIHISSPLSESENVDKYKSRLSSLLHLCLKFYTILSFLLLFTLLIVGYIYFNRYGKPYQGIEWKSPWIVLSIGTAIRLFQSPLTSYIQGLGKVVEMNKMMFYQQIALALVTWLSLAYGLKLYALGFSTLAMCFIWFFAMRRDNIAHLLYDYYHIVLIERISYIREIFPMQWKIAVSWISGYFTLQFFSPVLFAAEGPIVAGQMGMTIQILSGIQNFAISWITTKIPMISGMIEMKFFDELKMIFNRTIKQMISVCLFLTGSFILLLITINFLNNNFGTGILFNRFLEINASLLLCACMLINATINAWATYMRCYKREPYMIFSISYGVCCCLSTIFLGQSYGLYGIVVGYFILTIIHLPWAYAIYHTKSLAWKRELI